MTLLVIGGTGTLGRQIVRTALGSGFQVRCIVRNKRTAEFLADWGAELIYGDLVLPETLPISFQGVSAVIDSSTSRPGDDDKFLDVDWYGKLMLIELAKRVKVQRFIFLSILNAERYQYIPLMGLKVNVENVLKNSGVPYTIIRCAGFYQALIYQYALPILEGKVVWVTGEQTAIPYIDSQDAAALCVQCLAEKQTKNKEYFIGSPQTWTSEEIIQLCETFSGQTGILRVIPIFALKLLRQITGFFEWSVKISERLAFVEILQDSQNLATTSENLPSLKESLKSTPETLLSLETYLREYFEMMLLVLEMEQGE